MQQDSVKQRGSKGQSTAAYLKYHDAIAVAESADFIEYNISQIARLFGLNATGLANQLRRHYPNVLPEREALRRRLGINDNLHHGVRSFSSKAYAVAVEMLKTTDSTIEEAAQACNVSFSGLREHIAFYHKDLVRVRKEKRADALRQERVVGGRTGTWSVHKPAEEVAGKYAEAVELYRTTSMSFEEIAFRCGVNKNTLRGHIRKWFPELIVERRGFDKSTTKLSGTKRYKKSVAEKYAAAVERLRNGGKSVRAVAMEFGFNSEVFRSYLREHYPELAARRKKNRI